MRDRHTADNIGLYTAFPIIQHLLGSGWHSVPRLHRGMLFFLIRRLLFAVFTGREAEPLHFFSKRGKILLLVMKRELKIGNAMAVAVYSAYIFIFSTSNLPADPLLRAVDLWEFLQPDDWEGHTAGFQVFLSGCRYSWRRNSRAFFTASSPRYLEPSYSMLTKPL